MSNQIAHSVMLEKEKCKGCINCIKKCPTEAIRVRNGKAAIIDERCIDCGECIRVCPSFAKKAISDPLSITSNFKHNIIMPAPTLYGQFKKVTNINVILAALLKIGFDDVFEVALAAQSISKYTNEALSGTELNINPVISAACPTVVKLIAVRFPGLEENVFDIIAPVELAAIAAREKAVRETGLLPSEIGVFFVSPCPAKITAAKNPIGLNEPVLDGVFSMTEIYRLLLPYLDSSENLEKLLLSSGRGISWAYSGGESGAIEDELFIAADGIENVVKILDEIENGKLKNVRFVELSACPGGCVGGCLTVENPFVARSRIKRLCHDLAAKNETNTVEEDCLTHRKLKWQKKLEYEPVLRIDKDRSAAIRKMADIERIFGELPDIDCGSCGAPSCKALAEDIVMGIAQEGDCVFKVRERMSSLFREMSQLQEYMPPPFREQT